MSYGITSVFCIAIMLGLVAYLVAKFFKYDRSGKIDFIKSFKKGKCAIIYVVAIPLFFIGDLYDGKDLFFCFFDAITKSLELVVLKVNFMTGLMSSNLLYRIAVYTCFCLVLANASMITISIIHQRAWNALRLLVFGKKAADRCIIIGDNEKSLMIYDTCRCKKLLIESVKECDTEELYKKGVTYKYQSDLKRLKEWLENYLQSAISKFKNDYPNKKINVIINNADEQLNLDWCGFFVNLTERWENDFATKINIYVFGNRDYEDIYSKYEQKSKGSLRYLNEYQQIAVDFIDRYPLTEFMDERHIDYKTSLIKKDVEINVSMIGFGRTNQQIFLSMVANNQFVTEEDGKEIVLKKVNYHLFDKKHTSDYKNLRHNYFRYKSTFFENGAICVDENEYLPLPETPANEFYYEKDDLKKSVSFNKNALNYVIVSLGEDYDSIDVTNKIVSQINEWGLKNTHVFVRVRDKKTFDDAKIFLDLDLCHPFGTDNDAVYDYSHIIQEKFTEMAIMRNYIYDIEHDMKHDCITEEERIKSRLKWFIDKTTVERESNVYGCLSLRNKLHLMGLDYRKKESDKKDGLSEEEYLDIYAKNDKPNIIYDKKGKAEAIKYSLDYKNSRRKTMAIQEHQRWNAFMIMKGFIPATKDDIANETDSAGSHTNGKNYPMRHHGNLTTFTGLETFRRIIAERDGSPEESCDVIKYDYQLLDGAWWLLDKNGFKITDRR